MEEEAVCLIMHIHTPRTMILFFSIYIIYYYYMYFIRHTYKSRSFLQYEISAYVNIYYIYMIIYDKYTG
jgi:hypothetical protein